MGDLTHYIGSSSSSIRSANAPVITVATGDITLDTGSELVIPEAAAKNWNNKVIAHTVNTSAVDMAVDGTYTITYTAVDTLGRTTVESRNVVVSLTLREIAVSGYGTFIQEADLILSWFPSSNPYRNPGSKFDWNHELTGGGHVNGKEAHTLQGNNPNGYRIVWFSNPAGLDFNGLLDTTSATWVLVKYNQQLSFTVADFSGGSEDLTNGSIAIPSSDITIT